MNNRTNTINRISNIGLFTGEVKSGKPVFIPNACVDYEDGLILYAGAESDAPSRDETRLNMIEGKGRVAIPGLANAHTHAAMTLLRGYGSDLSLHDWLNKKIFPAEEKLTPDDIYIGSALAFVEMLRFGVTAACDMYMYPEEVIRAAVDTGIRLCMSYPVTGDARQGPAYLEKVTALYEKYHGSNNGRIRVMLSLHAEYTSTPELVAMVVQRAKELGAAVNVHVSETRAEVEGCKERHGVSPVRYFQKLGLFDNPTMAAHCVYLGYEDIRILADKNVTVAHNPVSNLKLASGVAPILRLLEVGARVALGTDGSASNNTLNLWEEIRLMSILHKGITFDPAAVSPAETLRAATLAGMRGMGYDRVGLLKEGWEADIVLIDMDGEHHCPVIADEPEADLVYSTQGSDVSMTIVRGEICYNEGAYTRADAGELIRAARAAASRVLT